MADSEQNSINMTKILVALDYSGHSQAALESAAFIARLMKANIHGLFVHDDQWLRIRNLPSLTEIDELTGEISPIGKESVEKEIRELEKRIKEHFEHISRQHRLSHTWSSVKGVVKEKVLEAAKDADLITIGSRGRSYSKTTTLGSTAVAVIQEAEIPVLILQKGVSPGRKTVAVYDGSEKSIAGVKMAVKIADKNSSRPVIIDLSNAMQPAEKSRTTLKDIEPDMEILELDDPNMGRFLFIISRLRTDLLIIPKDPRFIKRHYLELILDSVRCPVLLAN